MKNWEIREIDAAQLKRAPYNPREMTAPAQVALENSLERFGLVEPVVWNKRTRHIVGGHQRVRLLRRAGVEKIPAVVVDLPLDEEKALNIALNNPALAGEYNVAALTKVLQEQLADDAARFRALAMDQLADDHGIVAMQQALCNLEQSSPAGPVRAPSLDEGAPAAPKQFPTGTIDHWQTAEECLAGAGDPEAVRGILSQIEQIVVSYSGGVDSSATLVWASARAREYGLRVACVYAETGVEIPGTDLHVAQAARAAGAELFVVHPETTFWLLCERRGAWPDIRYRSCITKLVKDPVDAWVKANCAPTKTLFVTGRRAEEAVLGSSADALRDHPAIPGMLFYAPLFAARKAEVRRVVEGSPLPWWPGYALGFARTACWCCPFQCRQQARALVINYPGLARYAVEAERKLGPIQPLQRPPKNFEMLACEVGERLDLAGATCAICRADL